ncbi:MAG TPA: FmdB family transcriptional regulator [Gemmataceae bacterium]|nr:FmdB family transcriptional regulator [Gemmataceae bacterium]
MPLYVYQVIEPNGGEGEVFEVLQEMSEPPLTQHPETGKPVQRLLGMPSAMRKYAPGNLSNQKLDRLGFTKYERSGKGTYEKTAGSGPRTITREK